MAFLSKVHLSCFVLSYLVAFGGELTQVLRARTRVLHWVILIAACAGLLAHSAYLVTRSQSSDLPPLVGSSHDWLLVLAWLGGLVYLLITTLQQRISLGPFLLPIVFALIGMALLVDDAATAGEVRERATHRWGMLHASTLVLGISSVFSSTVCAVMYLLQYQKLRGGASWLHGFQFPSLERLTSICYWLASATVLLLTVGLVTGFVLSIQSSGQPFQWTDPIVAGTVIVWGLMVTTFVWQIRHPDESGRKVARLTLLAGGFLLLTVFGLMLLSGGVHGQSEESKTPENSETQTSLIHEYGWIA